MVSIFEERFKNLKKTIKGKNNTFFLVNDTNNEIRQHYDETFESSFDVERFKKSVKSKKDFLNNKSIAYSYFVVPDKSVVLREYLPFDTIEPIRHINDLEGYVYDINDVMTNNDFQMNDTHIAQRATIKIVAYVISKMYDEDMFSIAEQLWTKLYFELVDYQGDLFADATWSYEKDEHYFKYNKYIKSEMVKLKDNYIRVETESIPEDFRFVKKRESLYYKNPESISDKKILLLHDSTTHKLIYPFLAYYKEVFCYWDHGYFNKELIDWFNPDDVVEIRTERMIDRPVYNMVEEDKPIKIPVIINIEECEVSNKQLKLKLIGEDYHLLKINSKVDFYLDDEYVSSGKFENGLCLFYHDLNDYSDGDYSLKIIINETNEYEEFNEEFSITIN